MYSSSPGRSRRTKGRWAGHFCQAAAHGKKYPCPMLSVGRAFLPSRPARAEMPVPHGLFGLVRRSSLAIVRRMKAMSLICAVGFLLLAGCGGEQPKLALVHGKVSHDGVPLPGGSIVFTPDAARGNTGPLACAEIQPDGTYSLRTADQPGAAPGWHRVTVVSVSVAPPPGPGQRFTVPRSLVDSRYRDPNLSGLTCEVKPAQDNVLDFNLD